jgi:hypothetical protein
MPKSVMFMYQGYQFQCSAEREGPARYRPILLRRLPWPSEELKPLLSDGDTCRTEAQALRQAEAQAMRWVDARMAHQLLST